MDQHALDPLLRLKPQRGRRMDGPASILVVPAPVRSRGIRWRLVAFAGGASLVAAGICTTVAALFS